MKLGLALLLTSVLVFSACDRRTPPAPDNLPGWLISLIRDLEAQPVANPPALIARYDYQGRPVYFLPPRCCDVWSDLYREDGAIICHPNGGLTGNGDGRCPDFLTERKNERIVWRDPRTGS